MGDFLSYFQIDNATLEFYKGCLNQKIWKEEIQVLLYLKLKKVNIMKNNVKHRN